jgi:hypothetical protein
MREELKKELLGGLAFFRENQGKNALIRDRAPGNEDLSSIASNGFALSAFAIAAHYGLASEKAMRHEALKILDGVLVLPRDHGFFHHFYDMATATPKEWTEISNIDSALLYLGALTAGNYFGGECLKKAHALVDAADWSYWASPESRYLYMAKRKGTFYAYWQDYAEQLMIYVLAAGAENPDFRLPNRFYEDIAKPQVIYKGFSFIKSHTNGLFTHLYSQLYLPFQGKKDPSGINWDENTRNAIKAHLAFAKEDRLVHRSYQEGWGLSACDGPHGYSGDYGAFPGEGKSDGTLAVYAAIACLPYEEEKALEALTSYYQDPKLIGPYGLKDSFNLDQDFYADGVIGIDKGIEIVAISDYLDQFVWKLLSQEERITRGFANLGIK